MRTLCKKALALCVVFALALTCFVGTLSVSAAEFNATITVAPVTVEQGETSVPVVLAINSAEAGINEALIKVSSTVGSIDAEAILVKDAAGTAYTEEELESLHYYVDYPQETTDLGSFFLSARTIDGVLGGVDSAFIKVVFTVDADIAVADYPVNIDVSGVKAASAAEDVIKFNYEEANISVVAPHVHNVVWTSDKAGNHTSSCDAEGCKDFEAVTEPCADENADNACDKCGYVLVTEPEHEHNYSYDYDADFHWTVCANEDGLCDTVTTEKVAHNFDATTGLCACGFKFDKNAALGRGVVAENKIGVKLTVPDVAAYSDYTLEMKIGYYDLEDTSNPFSYNTKTILFKNFADGEEIPEGYVKQYDYAAGKAVYIHYVAAYEYTCPVEAKIHFFDANGKEVAISQTWSFTVSNRILNAGIQNKPSDAVYVDLMNYGAAVQNYFAAKYPDSDLADATLPTVGYEAYQQYATPDSEASLDTIKSINSGTAANGSNAAIGKGLLIEDSNVLRFRILPPTGKDITDLTLKVDFTDSIFGEQPIEIDGSDIVVVEDGGNTYYYYYCKNIALYDTEAEVTVELYDGTTLLYTRIYSVESGLFEIKESAPEVCKAIEKLTVSLWDTLPALQGK